MGEGLGKKSIRLIIVFTPLVLHYGRSDRFVLIKRVWLLVSQSLQAGLIDLDSMMSKNIYFYTILIVSLTSEKQLKTATIEKFELDLNNNHRDIGN